MNQQVRFAVYNIGMAALLLLLTPLVFGPVTSALYSGWDVLSVAIPSMYALVAGYLFSRVFDSYGNLRVISSGVIGSAVFATTSGAGKVIYQSLNAMSQSPSSMPGAQAVPIGTRGMTNPDLLFISTLISFNFPIIYSLTKRSNLKTKHLLVYILPVLIYLAIPAIFSGAIR